MSKKKNTTAATDTGATETTPPKPKRTRPRTGSWTKIVKKIPIPRAIEETDRPGESRALNEAGEFIDLEFYRVEFCGETIEVRRDRAGVAKANGWIRAIKGADERNGRMLKLHAALLVLEGEETRDDMKRRLGVAAAALLDTEPTA